MNHQDDRRRQRGAHGKGDRGEGHPCSASPEEHAVAVAPIPHSLKAGDAGVDDAEACAQARQSVDNQPGHTETAHWLGPTGRNQNHFLMRVKSFLQALQQKRIPK